MKKSTFILAAAAVSFALVGCEKKGSVEQQASGELIEKTFYANQGGKEKTTLNPSTLATLWTAGDALKVYPETGGAGNDFTLAGGAGESEATFTGLTTLSDVYVAFYPAGNAKSISGSKVTFSMPAVQTITSAGSFNTNTVPMVGYTTDNSLAMLNVGSLFELGLKAKEGTPKVVKIELIGNNGENLAGDFTVDASVSGQPTAAYSANGATTLTINCGEYSSGKYQGIALNASSYTYFYISIPAGVFTSGFTAILTAADGKTAEVTTTADLHKDAAKITKFGADNIEFKEPLPKDACGNVYNTVKIGEQVWLKENMRCNKYDTKSERAGVELSAYSSSISYNTLDPYYTDPTTTTIPDYLKDQSDKLGLLYNWTAAMGYQSEAEARSQTGAYSGTSPRQGICPNGFHIPSKAEWETQMEVLGGWSVAAKHMKTSTGWRPYGDVKGDGDEGFAALPAGYGQGGVWLVGENAYYWSSDANSAEYAFYRNANYANDGLFYGDYQKYNYYSVRCIKD